MSFPPPPVVLIDGIDGSGKTRFASRLAAMLEAAGRHATLLHVDDVRRPVDWSDSRGEAEVYWSDYFDLAALDAQIAALRAVDRVVLVEGIFTLRLAAAEDSELIYLEVPFDEATRRILTRDTALGRTPDEVLHRMEARYFPAQRRYRELYGPLARAALLVDNTMPDAPRRITGDSTRLPPGLGEVLGRLLGEPTGGTAAP